MRALLLSFMLVTTAQAGDAGVPRRTLREVKLLVFTATWCGSCRRFEAGGALNQVTAQLPELTLETVDVDARRDVVERYGVEVTPTVVLVDASGFPLARPRIDLAEPTATAERVVKLVKKLTR
ncbi:MAG: thioredoxin family protein [Archangium sp.]|nr:thioredoxin family protein [Archangium sp.]